MKKIKLSFLLCVCYINVIAQTTNGHLKIMGIPIVGETAYFVSKIIEQNGFSCSRDDYNYFYVLYGTFASYPSQILVDNDKYVNKVTVFTNNARSYESWNQLKDVYTKLKQVYKKKYGKCKIEHEYFTQNAKGHELQQVRKGHCLYECIWNVYSNTKLIGSIQLNITQSAVVRIQYTDINGIKKINRTMNDDI